MKKYGVLITALCILAGVVCGAMDDKVFNLTATNGATNSTTVALRGTLEGVYVNAPAGGTGVVTVATAHETLFTATVSSDAMYRPRLSTHTAAGAAATFNAYSMTGTVANAQTWYSKGAMAGPVTVTVVESGVGTNWAVTVIYDR